MDWTEIDTVLLDLDGTLLDLKFDNYFWSQRVPEKYAELHQITIDAARADVMQRIMAEFGTLQWYCTDFWSEQLNLDIIALKKEVRNRIGLRPGTSEFLASLAAHGRIMHLVTNAHPDTVKIKLEQVPIRSYFQSVWTSHELGHAKESAEFWPALQAVLPFNPDRALFIDDNEAVLDSAAAFGIRHLRTIAHPDSDRPQRHKTRHVPVGDWSDLTRSLP